MFAVDVRLLDSSWGRLMALSLENRLDDFDRVAVERAALAVAIDLLAQQHDEHLRAARAARSCPTWPTAASRRQTRAGAPRRSAFPGAVAARCCRSSRPGARRRTRARRARRRRRASASVADGITWTRLSGDLRSALTSTGLAVLLGRATSTC